MFVRVLKKDTPENFTINLLFSPKKLAGLFILKDVKPSPDSRMIKRKNCSRHFDILTKTRSRMTTAITFSRENDAGSLRKVSYS